MRDVRRSALLPYAAAAGLRPRCRRRTLPRVPALVHGARILSGDEHGGHGHAGAFERHCARELHHAKPPRAPPCSHHEPRGRAVRSPGGTMGLYADCGCGHARRPARAVLDPWRSSAHSPSVPRSRASARTWSTPSRAALGRCSVGTERIAIVVACAEADRQSVLALEVPVGCTAGEALDRSGILALHPAIDAAACGVGIFGREVPRSRRARGGRPCRSAAAAHRGSARTQATAGARGALDERRLSRRRMKPAAAAGSVPRRERPCRRRTKRPGGAA